MSRVAEEADGPRRDEEEEGTERGQPEQHQPDEGRRDAPGALLVRAKEIDEDGHERGRERRVRDERANEVRQLVGDREGVDLAGCAEVVRGDHLAHEPEQAGEPGRRREDRRRHGESRTRRLVGGPRAGGVAAGREHAGTQDDGRIVRAGLHEERLRVEVRLCTAFAAAAVAFEPAQLALAIGIGHSR